MKYMLLVYLEEKALSEGERELFDKITPAMRDGGEWETVQAVVRHERERARRARQTVEHRRQLQ